jgi:hypothetical protein
MAHFAKIENDIVTNVIKISNEVLGEPDKQFPDTDNIGKDFISNVLRLDGEWIQTSYNSNFRSTYAGIGMKYDRATDSFIENIGV